MLPLAALQPAEDNPRDDPGDVEGLSASIRALGVLHPLTVTPNGDSSFTVVSGARRLAAATEAGLEEVPCLVRTLGDMERQELMLVENLQRSNLSPLEEARAFQKLLLLGHNQKSLAERLGKSPAHVCRRLRLLTLPPETQELVDRGDVPLDQALGYRAERTDDLFAADEDLQQAWLDLRGEVLNRADLQLIGLLRDFAKAYMRWSRLQREDSAGLLASRIGFEPERGARRRRRAAAAGGRSTGW
jgi:ParB/RepB/Spo0J family partition protein